MSSDKTLSRAETTNQASTEVAKEKANKPKEIQLEFSFMDSLKPSQLKKAGRPRKR
jgi:hypothetical protein